MRAARASHAATLKSPQELWDAGRRQEAIHLLEADVGRLRPEWVATDAFIVATLATYLSDEGDPQRGLEFLRLVPLDGVRLTDVHLICLGARCACRAAAGDLRGAQRDRDTIRAANPSHPSLLLADAALGGVPPPP